MNILVVGSVALDTVETPFGKTKSALGGSATYFSISASFFAGRPSDRISLVAVVGTDFPSKYIKLLKSYNIDLQGLKKQKGKTFRWTGKYEYDLNVVKTLSTCLNVFERFSPEIPQHCLKNSPYVFLANIDPDLQNDVLKQVCYGGQPKLVACDTMNFWITKKRASLLNVLKKVDILLINESEARQLSEEPNLIKAARKILSFGPKSVVIKRGEYGSIYFSNSTVFSAPSYPLENVYDPTGAGDSFAGGFIGYLARCNRLNNKTIKQAMIFGTVLGSFCVEDFSLNRLTKLTWNEILKRYREIKLMSNF